MNLFIHLSRKTYMFPSLHSMMLVADSDNGAISVQMTAISSWWDERQRTWPQIWNLESRALSRHEWKLVPALSDHICYNGRNRGTRRWNLHPNRKCCRRKNQLRLEMRPKVSIARQKPFLKRYAFTLLLSVCRLLKTKIMSWSVWKTLIVLVA